MANLKRIIEVDCKTAKSIKGGDSSQCDCYVNCNCGSSNTNSTDASSNRAYKNGYRRSD